MIRKKLPQKIFVGRKWRKREGIGGWKDLRVGFVGRERGKLF